MGKRSDYERVDRDFYPTPWQAVEPLVPHLPSEFAFAEPCAGDGALVNHIETLVEGSWCSWASDIEPQSDNIHKNHFRDLGSSEFLEADYIITNPPWSKMQAFLEHGMKVSDNIVYLTTINHYTTKRRIREMRSYGFAVKEIYCVDTPKKPWPQLGFQLAAVHTQRGYTGGTIWSYDSDVPLTNVSQEITTPLSQLL